MNKPVCNVCRFVRLDFGDLDEKLLVVVVGGDLVTSLPGQCGHLAFT